MVDGLVISRVIDHWPYCNVGINVIDIRGYQQTTTNEWEYFNKLC